VRADLRSYSAALSPGQGRQIIAPRFNAGFRCASSFIPSPARGDRDLCVAACEWTLSPLPGLRDIDSARSAPGLKTLGYYLSPRFGGLSAQAELASHPPQGRLTPVRPKRHRMELIQIGFL